MQRQARIQEIKSERRERVHTNLLGDATTRAASGHVIRQTLLLRCNKWRTADAALHSIPPEPLAASEQATNKLEALTCGAKRKARRLFSLLRSNFHSWSVATKCFV